MISSTFRTVPLPLSGDSASELAAPDDQRVVEQSSLFEILNQCCAGLIGVAATRRAPAAQPTVMIPVRVEELNKSNAAFGQPSR